MLRHLRGIRDARVRRDLAGTFFALLAAFTFLSASRQLGAITALSTAFLYFGALLGTARYAAAQSLAPVSSRAPAPARARVARTYAATNPR
jgi:hypothetical protein